MRRRGPKPGWYLLAAVVLYAITAHLLWRNAAAEARRLRADLTAQAEAFAASTAAKGPQAPAGLWFPIPGASIPSDPNNMPGAPRPYRQGVSQGFDFTDGDAGVPIVYGEPVIASQAGQVVRADTAYVELSGSAWQALLDEVGRSGADATQLDSLRGRQIWIRTADGLVLRYGFLAALADGIAVGSNVYRGQVIGYVGNSGTGEGVAGTTRDPRLHFEVWQGDAYFGEGLTPAEVRQRAASLFVGP